MAEQNVSQTPQPSPETQPPLQQDVQQPVGSSGPTGQASAQQPVQPIGHPPIQQPVQLAGQAPMQQPVQFAGQIPTQQPVQVTAQQAPTKRGAKQKGGCLKVFLIIFGVLVLLSVIGVVVGGSEDSSSDSSKPAASSEATNTSEETSADEAVSADEDENAEEEQPAEEEENTEDAHAGDTVYEISKGKFETVAEPEMTFDEFGWPTINGSIKNVSGKERTYVQIDFTLYDADGAQIGSAFANINNLEEDGVWKYEAVGLDEGVASFKLADISYW